MAANIYTLLMINLNHGDAQILALSLCNLPSHVVFATTGMKCAYFKKDTFIKSQKKYKGRGRIV